MCMLGWQSVAIRLLDAWTMEQNLRFRFAIAHDGFLLAFILRHLCAPLRDTLRPGSEPELCSYRPAPHCLEVVEAGHRTLGDLAHHPFGLTVVSQVTFASHAVRLVQMSLLWALRVPLVLS